MTNCVQIMSNYAHMITKYLHVITHFCLLTLVSHIPISKLLCKNISLLWCKLKEIPTSSVRCRITFYIYIYVKGLKILMKLFHNF